MYKQASCTSRRGLVEKKECMGFIYVWGFVLHEDVGQKVGDVAC